MYYIIEQSPSTTHGVERMLTTAAKTILGAKRVATRTRISDVSILYVCTQDMAGVMHHVAYRLPAGEWHDL